MKAASLILLSLFLAAGCSSLSVTEREIKRVQPDDMAEKAIAGLVEQDPARQQKLDGSLGYAVAIMKVIKIPIVGAGGGASATSIARVIRIKFNSELTNHHNILVQGRKTSGYATLTRYTV